MARASDPLGEQILAPLSRYYDDPRVVEVRINGPGEITVDIRDEGKKLIKDAALTLGTIEDICRSLANRNGLIFNTNGSANLSCPLPGGHRFECLLGPSAVNGVSLSIRCKHPYDVSWEEYGIEDWIVRYLQNAMDNRRNIIISGGTNTGKTTLLNKLLGFWGDNVRVVATEDTPEVNIDRFYDGQGLLAARHEAGSAGRLTWRKLFDHQMRITPDAILFGEISTENSVGAVKALSAGVSGFICTIHSNNPREVIEHTFVQNVNWSGDTLDGIPEALSKTIDIIIQLERGQDSVRRVTQIYEPKTGHYVFGRDNPAAPETRMAAE